MGPDAELRVRRLAVSEQTFHGWRNQSGGMKANEAKRLKEMELENRLMKSPLAAPTTSSGTEPWTQVAKNGEMEGQITRKTISLRY